MTLGFNILFQWI